MRPFGGVLAAALVLAAADAPPPQAVAPATPAFQTPAASTCDAPALAYLVGRPKEEIPVPVIPSRRRVVCDACPRSQDFRPERTDILFDANTGLITAVTCG